MSATNSSPSAPKAREEIRKRLGNSFAEKATDLLCIHLTTGPLEAFSMDHHDLVLEFSLDPTALHEVKNVTLGRSKARLIEDAKVKFSERTKSLQADLQQKAESIPQYCWLNQTARFLVRPRAIAELAEDSMVDKLDLPRAIQIEQITEPSLSVFIPRLSERGLSSGKDVLVGIIDSEVSLTHPALTGRVHQRQNRTSEPWSNPHWHGTAVAGIVGANGAGLLGMAPECTLYNYKVVAPNSGKNGNDFQGALALQDAVEDGVHVINCSWGTGAIGDGTSREARACNNAWNLGLVIIKSAGNQGMLTSPADAEGVIVVGATDRWGTKVQPYSGRGQTTDGRLRPHLVAPGGSDSDGMISCVLPDRCQAAGFGTSFAAPVVTGVVARLLERDPLLTPDEVRSKLIELCKPITGEYQ